MLMVPTINNDAKTTYINQELFGLALFDEAGFFSGLVGSGIRLSPLKAMGENEVMLANY